MNIEFVYFDLGNVIVSFDPKIAVNNVATRFGVDAAMAEQAIYRSGLQDRFEHGHVTGEEYAAIVRDVLAVSDADRRTAGRDQRHVYPDRIDADYDCPSPRIGNPLRIAIQHLSCSLGLDSPAIVASLVAGVARSCIELRSQLNET